MTTIYGIPTCDTCRKARRALPDAAFADIRAQPLDGPTLARIVTRFGEAAINRRSTTWRGLTVAERAADPAALIRAHPTLLKRPVIVDGARMTQGWDAGAQASWGVN
ncbi:MAG: arsenate reductase family protein [Paracoccaceae bacterium]